MNILLKKSINLIVNEHCALKVLTNIDVSANYVNWLNDYEVMKYTEQKNFNHTSLKVKKFVIEKYKSKHDFLFGIFFNSQHIGNIKLGPINWVHLISEISYFVGEKDFWWKGISSAVVKRVVNFGFNEIGLKKINAGFYEKNIASSKVFKRCGFTLEGIRKKNVIFEGKRLDTILVGIENLII